MFRSYNDDWEKAYFDEFTGGFNVYHKDHIFNQIGGIHEKIVGILLARQGKQVEFLPERNNNSKHPDLYFDNQIRKYIKDARKANNALFHLRNEYSLSTLSAVVTRSIGYFKNKNAISDMPSIYYMDSDAILKQLFINENRQPAGLPIIRCSGIR